MIKNFCCFFIAQFDTLWTAGFIVVVLTDCTTFALFASILDTSVVTDCTTSTIFTSVSSSIVLTDACTSTTDTLRPYLAMRTNRYSSAISALLPLNIVLTDACTSTVSADMSLLTMFAQLFTNWRSHFTARRLWRATWTNWYRKRAGEWKKIWYR